MSAPSSAFAVERFYLACLSHASYLIHSDGLAAVIDPQRDVEIYLAAAERLGVRIAHIIETHLHADFVSGHQELAHRTGATIYLGPASGATFPHIDLQDNQELAMGRSRLRFLSTPGHTLESICILLTSDVDPLAPPILFTGDTLFIGDVGRPDLSPTHTPQQLAALLYQSLHEKILTLPDSTVIYPAHGAGSLCGRQLGSEAFSTIGEQRRTNYALQAKSAGDFVQLLTENMPTRPEYFERDADLNRRGAVSLSALPALTPLTPQQVLDLQQQGAIVVDTRPAIQFAVAHIPGSLHIALTGQYASWAARILGLDSRLILVVEDPSQVSESQVRLARVGVENVSGYLADGIPGWIQSGHRLDYIPQITAAECFALLAKDPQGIEILDVREPGEHASGALPHSRNIPLGELASRTQELNPQRLIVVHCKGGYRSSIATSILRRAGFLDIANLTGGYDALSAAYNAAPPA